MLEVAPRQIGLLVAVGGILAAPCSCTSPPAHSVRAPETTAARAPAADAGSTQQRLDAGQVDSGTEAQDASADHDQSQTVEPPPSPIFPIHPERWFDASRSPTRPIALQPPVCIRDVGGCPFKPAQLPPCPRAQVFVDIVSQAQMDRLVGQDVVIRGVLRAVRWETSDYVARPCTQHAPSRRDLRLTRATGSAREVWETAIVLSDPRFPHAFGCASDEFTTCCGLPLMVQVLVAGRLARPTQDFSSEFYELVRPRLCRMGGEG